MKYFSIDELQRSAVAAGRGIVNVAPPEAVQCLTALVENVLDPLRQAWYGPIFVTSGYRCKELNRAVGGAPHSQHLLGQAADITTGSIAANLRLLKMLQRLHLPVDQVINEHRGRWLHVSYGPRHRRQYLTID